MATFKSTIRPAPGADGPFFVVTESGGVVSNVTLGIANVGGALDQCKTDQAALLGSLTHQKTEIITTAT